MTATPPTDSPAPTTTPRAATSLFVETARFTLACVAIAVLALVLREAPGPLDFRTVTTCAPPVAEHPDVRWIEQDDARALVDTRNVLFVDARADGEFLRGHVPDALAMPMDTGALDPQALLLAQGATTVVAYCDTHDDCAGSRRLAGLLVENGVPDVRVLRGGMPLWLANDFPAESGPCTRCP